MAEAKPTDVPANFETIPCPGCGGASHAPAYTGKDWILGTEVLFHVVRCTGCGLHYVNPRPNLETIGAYYPEEYRPYQRGRGEIERSSRMSTWLRMLVLRNAYAAPALRPGGVGKAVATVASWVKSPEEWGSAVAYMGKGRHLDFGCGNGTFLRRMAAMGWDVTGLDFSATAVAAVQKSGLKALQGTLPHSELKPRSFDLITMRHSLEHVPQPLEVLRAARELLDDGGELLVQVPNFGSWDIGHFGDASILLELPRHLLHFTPLTLEAMLTKCGFAEVKVRQNGHANWLRKSARSGERYRPGRWDGWLGSKLVSRLVAGHYLKKGMGNELVATARKGA